jgi:hypothetical protein
MTMNAGMMDFFRPLLKIEKDDKYFRDKAG